MVNPSPALDLVVDRDAGHSAATAQISDAGVWSAAMDVGGWLRGLGLGQYATNFRDNKIDADLLPRLTDAGLKDIGVSALGDRLRLLDAIAALAGAKSPPDVRASPSKPSPARGPQISAERRPITVMFCDLVGSTGLAAKLDPEDWRNLVNAYLDEASKAVIALGGHVLKKLGDGLMALFGYPQAQENDAERAVRAALAIQRALAEINVKNGGKGAPELSARIGLESGPVVVDATGEVFGDAPNVAARVQAVAEPGSVLVTLNVQRQVAGLFVAEEQGARELKGVTEPVHLFRIVRASGGGRRGGARALTPFVGREEEMSLLARRWERARAGEGQLVLIVGEPGLGKSRLVEEFHTRLAETPHTWTEWCASQLLQNTPLHPIAEWGRIRFGVDAPAEQRLADLEGTLRLIGLDPTEHAPLLAPLVDIPLPPGRETSFAPEELRRRQLAALVAWALASARAQPIVLAFEDLQWADPTSIDLIRALAARSAQAPLLIVATARPEFRPPWGMRSHHTVMSLAPLDRAQVRQMVGELASRHVLSKDVIEGVSERTGGVPLFVEEVTRLLLERGEQGGVQAIPPTLQQSLAARLDRLGPAREVAQIGAVLGREFGYPLLRGVAELDESTLQASLDRVAEADLLFVEGAPPQANYRFKHALIQDAAYESLLKSLRQALHRRAAGILRDDPERAAAEPEVIAHHFTQGGLDDLAIEWWGKAGDQALRRSAFQEAIAHLGKAIAMTDKAGAASTPRAAASTTAASQRLKFQTSLGQAMMHSRGFGSDESKNAFARARTLAAGVGDASERFDAYYGLLVGSFGRGELSLARETAESFLHDAEHEGRMTEAAVARRNVGMARLYQGDFIGAEANLAEALRIYDPVRDRDTRFRFGTDTGAAAAAYLTLAIWALGDVERAPALGEEALARADETAHAPTRALVYCIIALYQMVRCDPEAVRRTAKIPVDLGREHGMAWHLAFGEVHANWARARLGDRKSGMTGLRDALAAYLGQGNKLFLPLFQGWLAQLEAEEDCADGALCRIDEAMARANETGERWTDSMLHRIRGEMLLKRDPAHAAPAEEAFLAAVAIARQQRARSFEMQASLSLAKLCQSTARPVEAHAVLAPALESFSPTPEMPEIAEAHALLAALQDIDEVKADVTQRRRMAHLRVAYGNALIATRGYGALETTEAFARARERAGSDKDARERLAADYGLWVGSYVRGELASMRAHAETFLSDVEARPDSPEAGVAHRTAGITRWFVGEYREAREHLERALALFQPGRDDDLAFRFGHDVGVAAMTNLAFVLWPLGDIGRAISLVGDAEARVARLAHVGTRAFGKWHMAMFELMRGDFSRAASSAVELATLTREHDLPLWRAYGVFLEGLSTSESGALSGGLEAMRRGVELMREQNILAFDELEKIALAEAEARAGDIDRAVAVLDEALAASGRTERRFDAELHRVRGEMLLKRDPANPATAEEALQTAVAVAKGQATRSFELRAALLLAKLYQSTGRPVEAHAVLAPALEGFSPMPEMPEIAEARALLAALAESEEVQAAEAQRQRRLHLQTAYGQAVMWSKGYAAEETRAAFARVRELAGGTENAAERFLDYYVHWVRSHFRGEHRQARGTAEAFLREAEEGGYVTEAGVARRCLGLTCLNQGDLVEARTLLERALADYRPNRDAEARFRFGLDSGVAAAAWLASATWHLGEVKRARQLAEQAVRSASELGHVPSRAQAYYVKTALETNCGDPAAALRSAETLLALARGHGMDNYIALGEVYAAWARGRLADPEAAAQALRGALAGHFVQGKRNLAPLFHGWLAELEAATRGPDAALTLIDQGLAIAEETGERWAESYLHRLRGATLLKRDPESHAPAEQSFQTAIAIAKRQSARSYELLASLALAKLYQWTNRPAEAYAVLAPALEGFAPTPEMPEIAEAMSLSARLA
jgi:class 3 adenylate cyclase/predicted ATPase